LRHLALAAVGEELRRLLERQPARRRDLAPHPLLDLAEPAAPGGDEVEADDLEDADAAPAGVRVLHVAELLDERAADAGLLPHLAERRLRRRLARVEIALRQRPHARRLALGPDRRQVLPPLDPLDQDAAGAEFTFHVARRPSDPIMTA